MARDPKGPLDEPDLAAPGAPSGGEAREAGREVARGAGGGARHGAASEAAASGDAAEGHGPGSVDAGSGRLGLRASEVDRGQPSPPASTELSGARRTRAAASPDRDAGDLAAGKEPAPDEEGLGDLARAMQKAGPLLTMGWTIAASVVLGVLGGVWLDDHFETKPLFTLLGSLFGIASAVVQFIRTIQRL
ncbi:MAG: AtpZ/AtpI family protein [Deltaproteobacteria bacterium]|nr:MAG: AtpZ/AtpI family protein [Deltaproteobacteria bacterium]